MSSYNLLFKPIEEYKKIGITKNMLAKLHKLGIKTMYDLFYYFPRAYENVASYKKIKDIKDEENVIIKGVIKSTQEGNPYKKPHIFKAIISDETGFVELIWFNSKYIANNISRGDILEVNAKVKKKFNLQMVNPSYRKKNLFSKQEDENYALEPIYSLTSGIKQNTLRKLLKEAINKYGYLLQENLPMDFIEENKVMERKMAILNIHFPTDEPKKQEALRRFTFEEIMMLEMSILKNKYIANKKNKGIYNLDDNKLLVKKYISSLGYELTKAQKKVITKIYNKLNNGEIINALIQGDVGSGKTVVSLVMLLYMVENDYQGVVMAPTEIVASQHYINTIDSFKELGIRVELLTGAIKGKKREKLLEDISNGLVDIVIGTHAVIEDNVLFHNLGLIVIDEQHKFGVQQRNALREKGALSNLIVMSATPIPRSLALTIYGDLDVLVIDELPLGRKPIETKWVKNDIELYNMYEFIRKEIKKGRQVYIVSPMIEESEKVKGNSAINTYEEYQKIFDKEKIGLLHGRQNIKEKQEIMKDFKDNNISILISTTVIEVGVDVSNATIMVIRSAERFGLSSLHQLRGRVGRGEYNSYCFLESFTENEISMKRLSIMENTLDGFKIAEEDLKIRDSGEIFGTKQSGLSELVLLDIVKHIKEIIIVKEYVEQYLLNNNGEIKNEILKLDIYNKIEKIERG